MSASPPIRPLLAALLLAALTGCRSLPWDITALELGLPEPRFPVTLESDVRLPVRDGVLLAADLYKPGSHGSYLTILVRTPYDKRSRSYGYPVLGGVFASQGYVVMIQDVRGKFKSQGEFYPLVHEAADGADTIQWIEETEITGPVRLMLHAASSAPDTDFRATLVDLMPDGAPMDQCTGIVRARFRDSLQQPSFLQPGASSDFPRHDRNLNTREPFGLGQRVETAKQTVFHNAAFPSRLVLPVIPAAKAVQSARAGL